MRAAPFDARPQGGGEPPRPLSARDRWGTAARSPPRREGCSSSASA